jgi:hypothetical protein
MSAKVVRRGVFLIGIGSVLLLNNFALLDWEIWYDLLRLWPVILICFGLERLFRDSRLSALTYLSPIVMALTFVGVIYYQGFSKQEYFDDLEKYDRELYHWSVEDEGGYSRVKLDIDFGAGSLWIRSGQGALLAAKLDYDQDPPRCRYDVDENVVSMRIRSEQKSVSLFSRKAHNDAKIEVSNNYPLDLSVDVGACDLNLDLSDFELTDFELDGELCDVKVKFGDGAEHLRAKIDLGLSDLDIQIPEGVGLKLIKDTALSSFDHRGIKLEKLSSSTYLSEGYSTAEKKIDIFLDAGLSSLTISNR